MKFGLGTTERLGCLAIILASLSGATQSAFGDCVPDTSTANPLSPATQQTLKASSQATARALVPAVNPSIPLGAKEVYNWKLSGTNYIANLNYQGNQMTETESDKDLRQSYSGVLQAGSSFYPTMTSDLSKAINSEVVAKGFNKYGYRGSNVTLGNKLSFKMVGQGTDTNAQITSPSIKADLVFKKEEAMGLLEADCTETLTIPATTVMATMDVTKGTLNVDPIVFKGVTATANCHDDIPLIGGFLAHLGDKLIDEAVQPTINKLNSTAGITLKTTNFGGINKLLGSVSLEKDGTNYGPLLANDLTNFFQTGEVDLDVYNPTANPPKATPTANSPETSTLQPLVTLNLPKNNIALNVQVQQVYDTTSHLKGNALVEVLENSPLLKLLAESQLANGLQGAAQSSAAPLKTGGSVAAPAAAVSTFDSSSGSGSGGNTPTTGAASPIPTTNVPSTNANGQLTNQVKALQKDLINRFESTMPSITELVHDTTTSNNVVDAADLQDSAIFTGVYLASQCLRAASSTADPTEQAAAQKQVDWALKSVERLFDVTGTPGSLARFAFNSNDPKSQKLAFAKTATQATGWSSSAKMPGWTYQGGTSRDQYTGILFGLGVCNQVSASPDIQKRTRARIIAAVNLLSGNGWKIPGNTSTSGNIGIQTQAAWLKLATVAKPSGSTSTTSPLATQYAATMTKLTTNLTQELEIELNPTVVNNYEEYYAWNLAYLQTYPLLQYEKNSTDLNYWQNYFTTKMWNETYNHGNAEFTFMKLGSMGVQGNRDMASFDQSLNSLNQLAVKNRRDFPVTNSANPSIALNPVPQAVSGTLNAKGFPIINSYLTPNQAANPLPMQNRAPDTFMWEISPFQLDGGGKGLVEAPSVDTIFAYWLGRYHHLISPQN